MYSRDIRNTEEMKDEKLLNDRTVTELSTAWKYALEAIRRNSTSNG